MGMVLDWCDCHRSSCHLCAIVHVLQHLPGTKQALILMISSYGRAYSLSLHEIFVLLGEEGYLTIYIDRRALQPGHDYSHVER